MTTRRNLLHRFGELASDVKRRRVLQVAFMYAAGGWVVVEGAGLLVEVEAISPAFARGVLVVVLAGFPVALVLGWIFDLGPGGVTRTPSLGDTADSAKLPAPPPRTDRFREVRDLLRDRSRESLEAALERTRVLTEQDPDGAPGHALSARALALLADDGTLPRTPILAAVRTAAARALELDPDLGEAHATLGFVCSLQWEWEAAGRHLERGANRGTDDADAHHWLALYLATLGRLDEALEAMNRALTLDPQSTRRLTAAAGLRYYARQPERALSEASRALEIDPANGFAKVVAALAHEQRRSYESASRVLKEALAGGAASRSFLLAALAHVQASAGDEPAALRMLDVLEKPDPDGEEPSYFGLGCVQAALGRTDAAIASLEEAVARHDGWIPSLRVHPWADPLRSVPAFAGLLGKAGLVPAEKTTGTPPATTA